jgi:geranylgeranyl pyrophosphate synthase
MGAQNIAPEKAGLPTLDSVRDDINGLLDVYYKDAVARAQKMHPSYGRLWSALHAAHLAGGKRLRPYVLLLTYAGLGGQDYAAALRAAAAVELLHGCMLVHDDIIDRDYIRHGRPNVAGHYREVYAGHVADPLQNTHYSHSAALLAGDLLLADAYNMLHTADIPSGLKLQALELLGQAVFVVAGGELLDTEAAFLPQESGVSLRIAELKTAHYSFVTTMQMGALLAGADAQDIEVLKRAGMAIGCAYQLADDLLGMFGDEQLSGKSASGDLAEGKRTYLIERGLELSDAAGRQVLLAALGKPEASPQARQAADTEAMMLQKKAEALQLIAGLPFSRAARQQLQDLFELLVWRRA